MGSSYVRVCPRCAEPNGPNANYCSSCGYKIVLFTERKPGHKRKPKPQPVPQPARVTCPYCGHLTRNPSGACFAHDDLPALEPDAILRSCR